MGANQIQLPTILKNIFISVEEVVQLVLEQATVGTIGGDEGLLEADTRLATIWGDLKRLLARLMLVSASA